jgi:beta-glucosidase
MKKASSITLGLILTSSLLGQQFPYQNSGLNSEERAKDLISRLTLDEKTKLMCDISDAIPRLGIKKFNWWSEALHGLAYNSNVTVFPEPVGMAVSFEFFDRTTGKMAVNPGEYEIWYGNSSDVRDLKMAMITIQ